MPRISAPTLVEHRAKQRAALLDAVEDLVVETGSSNFTMASVATRAGLARSSVYEYFDSPNALFAGAVIDRMHRWTGDVESQVATSGPPAERIERFIRLNLELASQQVHRFGRIIRSAEMPPECSDALNDMHREILKPLIDAIDEAGIENAEHQGDFVNGVIQTAISRIDAGAEREAEAQAAVPFALKALGLS